MNANDTLREAAKSLSSLLANQDADPDELYEALNRFEQVVGNPANPKVLRQIRQALALGKWPLGDLAALIGSWGDTLDDQQVLEYLKTGPALFHKVYSDVRG